VEAVMAGDGVVLWGAGTMRTHRTLWLARELGIDYEHRPIQPRTGETKTSEFLQLNPRHKVPVMTHGDLVLTESAAILNYLSEAFPVPDHFYVPADAVGRARLLEWCFFGMSELDANSLYTMRRHGDLKALYGDAPVAVSSAQDYFLHQIDAMKERLKSAGEFLMGARISIADILFVSCLDWARWYDIPLPDYLMAYQQRLGARPAYLQAFAENYPDRAVADVR
jgi:glutathione S-transferase